MLKDFSIVKFRETYSTPRHLVIASLLAFSVALFFSCLYSQRRNERRLEGAFFTIKERSENLLGDPFFKGLLTLRNPRAVAVALKGSSKFLQSVAVSYNGGNPSIFDVREPGRFSESVPVGLSCGDISNLKNKYYILTLCPIIGADIRVSLVLLPPISDRTINFFSTGISRIALVPLIFDSASVAFFISVAFILLLIAGFFVIKKAAREVEESEQAKHDPPHHIPSEVAKGLLQKDKTAIARATASLEIYNKISGDQVKPEELPEFFQLVFDSLDGMPGSEVSFTFSPAPLGARLPSNAELFKLFSNIIKNAKSGLHDLDMEERRAERVLDYTENTPLSGPPDFLFESYFMGHSWRIRAENKSLEPKPKPEEERKGQGLKIIKKITSKYAGNSFFKYEDGVYRVLLIFGKVGT